MNKREKYIAKCAHKKQKAEDARVERKKWVQKKEELRSAYTGIVMCSLIALFCALMASWCWPRFRANYLVPPENWKRIEGTMQSIEMGYSSGRNAGWWLRGTYCYKVDEQQFTSSRLGFNLSLDKVGVESFYKFLQPSTSVTVFYEKGDPEFSTLYLPKESEKHEAAISMSVLSLLALFFVVRAVLYARSSLVLRRKLQTSLEHPTASI